jgi:hypothetical protein
MVEINKINTIKEFIIEVKQINKNKIVYYDPLKSLICNKAIELKISYEEINKYQDHCKSYYALNMFEKTLNK